MISLSNAAGVAGRRFKVVNVTMAIFYFCYDHHLGSMTVIYMFHY